MESYFERVVDRLTEAGYRWYETANFCRASAGRDLRSRHNLAYWRGRDYLGLGIGAVSTIDGRRWRTTPRLGRYLAALQAGERPERELEELPPPVRGAERVLLGLRLDEPLSLAGLGDARRPGRGRAARAARPRRARPRRGRAGPDRARALPRRRRHGGAARVKSLQMRDAVVIELNSRQRAILRGVVEEYVASRQPVGSRTLLDRVGLDVSASTVRRRARRARAARPADAPAHLGRTRPDRARLPLLRRPAARAARPAARRLPARPDGRAERGRLRAAGDHRDALRADPAAGTRLGAVARDARPCATSRCCCSSRRS